MGECDLDVMDVPYKLSVVRNTVVITNERLFIMNQ